MEENKAYDQIIGNNSARYLNKLAGEGASLQQIYGIRHPSEPNYLALFSGTTQGMSTIVGPIASDVGELFFNAGHPITQVIQFPAVLV